MLKLQSLEDKYQGCLVGLAIGDAVGTTLEFMAPGTFDPITDMTGGGPFNLNAGAFTDDTSMALCLAHSLLYQKGFNAADQMNRYCNWWQYGYMSSTGECFDIGMTVSSALERYLKTKDPYSGSTDRYSAGNGSLMRLAPIPMYFYPNIDRVIHYSAESSKTTHGASECIDACCYFSILICRVFQGKSKDEIFRIEEYIPKTENISAIVHENIEETNRDEIKGTGYVIDSLRAALWCFATTDSFREAILKAANLGDDADTTAAICGQLAGAFYGYQNIPKDWLNKLAMLSEIRSLSCDLLNKSGIS